MAKGSYLIDSAKLKNILQTNKKTSKYNLAQLSILLGYSDGDTLKVALTRDYITNRMASRLEEKFGITYDEYKLELHAPKEAIETPESMICVSKEELRKIIKEAVKDGILAAFEAQGRIDNADTQD